MFIMKCKYKQLIQLLDCTWIYEYLQETGSIHDSMNISKNELIS